ncbi:MAG: TonB-dependent receptor [Bacteroidales bacterium]|jgi:hypothetical protein|nr:TonB-dependent receptor [Bacteroidales bacterium]
MYKYSTFSLSIVFFALTFLTIQAQDVPEDIKKEFQNENSFALGAIDESTSDEDADVAGQNFSTLATFSNDPYLSEIGYQLSGFRFNPRGIKNIYGQTYINGIEFNSLMRGNFNYSMIGGMNDMSRNVTTQDFLQPSLFSFGDLGGAQNYDMRAGSYARGTKVTLTYTNRNYQQRLMVSHNTGLSRKGWAFSALLGGRYAYEGNVEGTFYHNLAYFLAVEKQWANGKHSLSLTTFGSPVQRAQQAASVNEAYDLMKNNLYNPYWGYMPDGKTKRNQRVVTAYTPTAMLSHVWKIKRDAKLTTGFGVNYNRYGTTTLDWYKNASDPRPDYYRNLPSYTAGWGDKNYDTYGNQWATERSQIDWAKIYATNANTKDDETASAAYLIGERRNDALEMSLNSTLDMKINEEVTLVAGINARRTQNKTFYTLVDLLGATYHLDIDKYGERDFPGNPDIKQNDLNNPNRKVKEGDIFGYNYNTDVTAGSAFGQMHHNYEHLEFFYGLKVSVSSFYRDGLMRNGRYPGDADTGGSYGKGAVHTFVNPAVKAGVVYKINGRNLISLNGIFKTQAPLPYNAYTAPRVSDEVVPHLQSEIIYGADLNYVFTFPKINGRISGYYTEYLNKSNKISYYNDAYGTFMHHSISDANQRNYGVEAGVKYNVWKGLSLSFAGSWSQFLYTNDPVGTIRYENNKADDVSGIVAINGFHVGGSPEMAGTFGVSYFWKYWWFEVNVNGIANNYLDPSYIQRSINQRPVTMGDGTVIDYVTEDIKEDVRIAAVNYLLNLPVADGGAGGDQALAEYLAYKTADDYTKQVKLDNAITMDISISKLIYLKGGKQLNINLTVSNVLNNRKVRTGGYEQGRIPYYNNVFDVANINKFPAKYYYMQGINVFLNVGFRF